MSLPKNCPIGPKKRRKPNKDLEGPVVKECLQYLIHCPDVVYTERRNTGAVKFQDGGFIRFGSKGAADIFCLLRKAGPEKINGMPVYWHGYPVHIEIECKRADGKGRQSPDQKEFQEFCDSHNIPYILVISAVELKTKIQAIVLDS